MLAALFAAALAISGSCDLEHPSGRPGCTRAAVDALPMNSLQVIGTHNSYKMAIAPKEMEQLRKANAKAATELDYSHIKLTDQLNTGARQLELDYVYDPQGGRYSTPLFRKVVPDTTPYDLTPMARPGLKVLHVPDIDYRSVCPLFVDCLREIRAWSKAHPDHVPILIIMNLKQDNLKIPGAEPLLPFDAKAMDAIDAEIRSVFPESELITPDKVQGRHKTLREAVLAGAWPRLKAARGKFMFAIDEPPKVVAVYQGGRTSLEGRVCFINSPDEASPAAGYFTLNEPIELAERIRKDVRAGFIVRTRADADTYEARKGDYERQKQAFASGAQYVSTDYMQPDPRLGPYEAHLPGGGLARLNPVRAAN
ncbi:phosphatidylinositol-specific phospholipase C1-like protein [Phenylobacterium sp.]|uniref:phosphatidylinositol-specific phospholipase C1-like protein n=1 Tax=Phenylobacterium sp. TaxID=1871053 RepID=UPI002DE4F7BE|nr:phosphatidylinositol-specific phospholipase C1-like protein [Phenylobacterium sp.]